MKKKKTRFKQYRGKGAPVTQSEMCYLYRSARRPFVKNWRRYLTVLDYGSSICYHRQYLCVLLAWGLVYLSFSAVLAPTPCNWSSHWVHSHPFPRFVGAVELFVLSLALSMRKYIPWCQYIFRNVLRRHSTDARLAIGPETVTSGLDAKTLTANTPTPSRRMILTMRLSDWRTRTF